MRKLAPILTVLLLLTVCHAQDEAEVLYKHRCAKCHGPDGAGRTPAGKRTHVPDLRLPRVQKRSDEELFKTIYYGTEHRNYPHVFQAQGITEGEARRLVKYIRGLAAK
jgi:mono/diheme cytochrome c family protein